MHTSHQLLTKAEEETICKWVRYMGMTGHPISKESLRAKVADIGSIIQEKQAKTGEWHLPAKNWRYSFLEWHPELDLKRPTGLDPKHAQTFNPTVVKRHFQLLGDFLNAHDIPWDNVYNMDEKGDPAWRWPKARQHEVPLLSRTAQPREVIKPRS